MEEQEEANDIKEEQAKLWISQEEQQFNGQEEADKIKEEQEEAVSLKEEQEELSANQEEQQPDVPMKNEDDKEKPQFSQLHHDQTEDNKEEEPPTSNSDNQRKTDGHDCGRSEPASNPDSNRHLQPNTDGNTSDFSETEVSDDDEDEWQETLSDSGPETEDGDSEWEKTETPKSDVQRTAGCNTEKNSFSCSECDKQFVYKRYFERHVKCHSQTRASSNLGNKKRMKRNVDSQVRDKKREKEKPLACDECGKRFRHQSKVAHESSHRRETIWLLCLWQKIFPKGSPERTHHTFLSRRRETV
ncbi:oocyte zinc finger protein XlCOF8.4-like isoform X2 [Amphiprion ocellaris]|uniref:oocyte zinc finger protein XlCOF8.4-like isoform X2 n=1 Tax=Amphiprion ocellaris TaxID=80972 RepID=UPI00241124BF|nr:oocyte zinc finger protein XlCOF8.4-like isoform X2 [Amphiprion ocellaris]XP_054860392.1 oocyte zinc finger protein XlCOF8.4-like isoform X2 [Amphiprion ocellaris]